MALDTSPLGIENQQNPVWQIRSRPTSLSFIRQSSKGESPVSNVRSNADIALAKLAALGALRGKQLAKVIL
jgi:hypothetical protein